MERYYNFKYSFHLNNVFFLKNNPLSFLKNRFFDLKSMRETMREFFFDFDRAFRVSFSSKRKKKSKHDFPTLVIILLLSIFAGGSNYRLVRRFESWQ